VCLDLIWRLLVALAKTGGSKAVDHLIKALEDSDRYTRNKAAELLGELGDRRAVQ